MVDSDRLPASLSIPDQDPVIRHRDGEPPAVGAPVHPREVPIPLVRANPFPQVDGPERPPGGDVPDSDHPLGPERRQALPVGPEGDGEDKLLVPGELVPDPAVGEADQVSRDIRAGAGVEVAVG